MMLQLDFPHASQFFPPFGLTAVVVEAMVYSHSKVNHGHENCAHEHTEVLINRNEFHLFIMKNEGFSYISGKHTKNMVKLFGCVRQQSTPNIIYDRKKRNSPSSLSPM